MRLDDDVLEKPKARFSSYPIDPFNFISIDERNYFAGSLLVPPVRIAEFLGQQFLLHPDPDQENRDQGRHYQGSVQRPNEYGQTNHDHESSQIDGMAHEPENAVDDELVVFPDY